MVAQIKKRRGTRLPYHNTSGFSAFRLFGFSAFRFSGFSVFRFSGFSAFQLSGFCKD
jgi:hypothetical protein